MKLGLATLAASVALGAAAPADASTPMPWCGTSSSAVDRLPDATPGFAVHVAYVRGPGTPDRFFELAPRIVGDVTAFDAWWRREDPARQPRFDLFAAPGCATQFGALDITNVAATDDVDDIDAAFQQLRQELASRAGFNEPEKSYLVYYDGPTNQFGEDIVCGQGARGGTSSIPGLAIVYLDACELDVDDVARPVVAVHELLHVFGAVSSTAPSACRDGHVCDFPLDLMTARVTGEGLDSHVLDFGRDDYYGHTDSRFDVQDSLFLERLDSPDRLPPTAVAGLTVRTDINGLTFVTWQRAMDESPVVYRVKLNGRLIDELSGTVVEASPAGRQTLAYSVQAADSLGHLGPSTTVRFAPGRGVVNAAGRLLVDTVPPSAVERVRIVKSRATVSLGWTAATDGVAVRGYRIQLGQRTLEVRRPAIVLSRSRLRTNVRIRAVDRAGNLGPATFVSLVRLR